MSTLIIGASGQVGGYLRRELHGASGLVTTYHTHKESGLRQLDIGNKRACEELLGSVRPDVILLPAAMTYVDGCENEPERCLNTNVTGVENVARVARELHSNLVLFSTDYVFSGRNTIAQTEEDPTAPVNFYAKSKVLAEDIVRRYMPSKHLIIRTAWVYGHDSQQKNFVAGLRRRLSQGETVKVPVDQWGSPTYAADLAQVTSLMVESRHCGTYHVVGPDWMNRFDFANKICVVYELDNSRLKPVKTDDLGQRAARPRTCLLSSRKMENTLTFSMRNPDQGLSDMKNEQIALQ